MKYIPGFTFTVGNVKQSGSLIAAKNKTEKIRSKCDEFFKIGNTYSIYNIKIIEESVIYTFKHTNGIREDIEFINIAEADKRISILIGE